MPPVSSTIFQLRPLSAIIRGCCAHLHKTISPPTAWRLPDGTSSKRFLSGNVTPATIAPALLQASHHASSPIDTIRLRLPSSPLIVQERRDAKTRLLPPLSSGSSSTTL